MKQEDDLINLLEQQIRRLNDQHTEPLSSLIRRYLIGWKPLKFRWFINRMKDRKKKALRKINKIRWNLRSKTSKIRRVKNTLHLKIACWFLWASKQRKIEALITLSVAIIIFTQA